MTATRISRIVRQHIRQHLPSVEEGDPHRHNPGSEGGRVCTRHGQRALETSEATKDLEENMLRKLEMGSLGLAFGMFCVVFLLFYMAMVVSRVTSLSPYGHPRLSGFHSLLFM
jgi:hypothetical protein